MNIKQHKIQALLHARNLIKLKRELYICYALRRYLYQHHKNDDYNNVLQAVEYLQDYIQKSLGQDRSLKFWLLRNGYLKSRLQLSDQNLIQTRLNWIDWMLECYGYKANK